MSRPFEARYGGRCAADCGEPIREGDQVVYEDDELVHADCEGKHEQQRPERPACTSCWTVHAGECL
jgi:hypothetical protein